MSNTKMTGNENGGLVNHQSEILAGFDALPDIARVRIKTVAALLACSTRSIDRHVRAGTIPAPQKLGGVNTWRVGDLRRSLGRGADDHPA
jgi:predicted DNA-binding transcriptional regulator AlpA